MSVKSFQTTPYGDFAALGRRENKANQSQFPALQLFREKNLLLKFRGYFRYIVDGSYLYAYKTLSILC